MTLYAGCATVCNTNHRSQRYKLTPRRHAPNPTQQARASRFAAELADALHALKLTHQSLAEELGLTRYTIDSWARAANPSLPADDNLERLCLALERRQPGLGARLASLAGAVWIAPAAGPQPSAAPAQAVRAPATSFVGREWELAEVGHLVNRARLATLTGPGGIGKTRLALAAAAAVLGDFADGVRVVEFAALANPAFVPHTVAAALGVREQGDRPLLEALSAALGPQQMLLVLDNCEHVLGACAALVNELLSRCPKVRMLATSREPLHVTGEAVWPVPPLSLPDPRQTPPGPQLLTYAAPRLFVERAFYLQSGFVLTSQNSAAVAQLCQQLDGIPLAIELAAACVRDLPVEAIAAHLDDRLRLLTRGPLTAPPRQQTLRATLAWSYDLLPAAERALFRRLSVFAGGWTLPAAEAICQWAGQRPAPPPVADALTQLVDKSLVVAEAHADGLRFHMLETLSEYAREQLQASGEAEARRAAHLAFYLALAEEAQPQLRGAQQAAWLNRLETEHNNLRAALSEALRGPLAEPALRLASALGRFWETRGYLSEGRDWLLRALARADGEVAAAALPRARACYEVGRLALRQGDTPTARTYLTRALALFQHEEQAEGLGQTLNTLGLVAMNSGDYAQARSYLEQALAVHRQADNTREIAVALNNLGLTAKAQGDYAAARGYYAESIAIKRDAGDTRGTAMSLGNLGVALRLQGDFAGARACSVESLALFRELGDKVGESDEIGNAATSALWQGDLPAARALFEETLGLHEQLGDRIGVAFSLAGLGHVARAQQEEAAARAYYQRALQQHRDLGEDEGVIEALEGLGVLAARQPDLERAARLFAALDAARAARRLALSPFEQAARAAALSATAGKLDDPTLQAAAETGRRLTLEQAAAEALAEHRAERMLLSPAAGGGHFHRF